MGTVELPISPYSALPLPHPSLCHFILLVRIECRDSGHSLLLGTGARLYCASFPQVGHECSELPLAWRHNQELSLDTDPSAKEGFSWSVAPLWQEEILYFLYAGLELGCIKASGGKTKEIRMEFVLPPTSAHLEFLNSPLPQFSLRSGREEM